LPLTFEEEFPNEPFAPIATGSSGAPGYYGGWIAPGNPFSPVPVGEPGLFYSQSAAEARESLPESGTGYVFILGEGFVPVDRSAPVVVPPSPTDWSRVSVPDEEEPIVYADIPVIEPTFQPTRTEGESSASNSVEEEPVSVWGDIASGIGGFIGDVATQWVGSGSIFGTPAPAVAYAQPQVVIPQRPMVPLTQGIDLMGPPAPTRSATVTAAPGCPPPGARYLRYNCATGEYSKIPRRRRRRLLTSSDLKDLAALKAIVGGGAKMDGAVVAAVRR